MSFCRVIHASGRFSLRRSRSWPPGGATDAFVRVLAQRLSTDTGRSFVVDNRGGGPWSVDRLVFRR